MIREERAFSLPELLLGLAIMALIAGALVGVIYQILDITGRGNSDLAVQHDLRNAAVWLNRDVLSASKATVTQEGNDYKMTLEVPRLITDTVGVTTTIDNIIYTCTGRDVEVVIVNGQVVVADGKLCTADEAELVAMAETKGRALIRHAVENDPELNWLWQ